MIYVHVDQKEDPGGSAPLPGFLASSSYIKSLICGLVALQKARDDFLILIEPVIS